MTVAQMREQHGQSGRTRQEILDDYVAEADNIEAAIDWVNHFVEE
jgi:uncharacterized protein (DUF433 family)